MAFLEANSGIGDDTIAAVGAAECALVAHVAMHALQH